jgi:S-DNA-T family DNA segregation ATPase FtsK/SpoIIIE
MSPEAREEEPRIVMLVDNFGAFASEFEDFSGFSTLDEFDRVYADGPEVGIHVAVTADRAGAVRAPMSAVAEQKLLLRLSDAADYSLFGIATARLQSLRSRKPGRGLALPSGNLVQVCLADSSAPPPEDRPAAREARRAPSIEILPEQVDARSLVGAASFQRHPSQTAICAPPAFRCTKARA